MQTKKGAYRLVLVGDKYVFKFASLRYFWGVVKSIPRMVQNGDGRFIPQELYWGLKNFWRGLDENISEFRCWNRLRAPFLMPTVLSLGILNIQLRGFGAMPTHEELLQRFSTLPQQAQAELKGLEAHCLEPGNFIKTPRGYVLLDYGNGSTPAARLHPFTVFLEKWHRQWGKAFLPEVRV